MLILSKALEQLRKLDGEHFVSRGDRLGKMHTRLLLVRVQDWADDNLPKPKALHNDTARNIKNSQQFLFTSDVTDIDIAR